MTAQMKRWVTGLSGLTLFGALSYVAISQNLNGSVASLLVKRSIQMTVSSKIDHYTNHSSPLTPKDLAVLAKNVRFPILETVPKEDRDHPVLVHLNQYQTFDSLAEAVLELNAKEKVYDPDELLRVAEESGRCSPAVLASLRAKYSQVPTGSVR